MREPSGLPVFQQEPSVTDGGFAFVDDGKAARWRQLAADERNSRLAAILTSSDDAIISKSLSGIIMDWNLGAERIFGFSAAEAVGQSIAIIIPDDRAAEEPEILNRLQHGERIDHFETRRRRKDGEIIDVSVTISPLRDSHGRLIGASKIARDVTAAKHAQAALLDSETRLREVQAELIHVSRFTAMGEMAATLAHELNQPLAAVANYLNGGRRLLDSGQEDGVNLAREAMEHAAAQALRAGQIIRRLRDFVARGESEQRVENLPNLVEEACALALVGLRETGVTVTTRLDPAATTVLADKVQIQQVLLNLIRNGIEAMETAATKHLVIATRLADDATVEISVADTGTGIAAHIAAQLFQPFITTKKSGMGVGLSISRTIVAAHGGRLAAAANPAGGSIFKFTLQAPSGEADD
jgi:two-component system sensor kinase FixL